MKHLLILFILFDFTANAQKDTILNTNKITFFQIKKDFNSLQNIGLQYEPFKSFNKKKTFNYYKQKKLVYDPVRDPKRLLYNTGLFTGVSLVTFGVLWTLPEGSTNWDKKKIKKKGFFYKWKENVKKGPVWDKDNFFYNWISHPWAGGVYYMSARGSGFNKLESFAYSAFVSTFMWEYGIEAFAEIPSWQDLLITPILGSVVGEQFFRWKGKIIRNDKKILNSGFLGKSSLFIMDPFNELLDGLGYKNKNKIQSYSMFAPIDYDFNSQKTIWGLQVIVTF